MKPRALLDSNVLIAVAAEAHEHHGASLDLVISCAGEDFAVAAHSYAETYSTLTRGGSRGPFGFAPAEAWAALESLRARTALIGLTPSQSFATVRAFATSRGIGARLYDKLIGEVAVTHGIPAIVTWNLGHMRALFPDLVVESPEAFRRSVR